MIPAITTAPTIQIMVFKIGLLGGANSAIELKPLTWLPGDGGEMIPTVLELDLKSIAS